MWCKAFEKFQTSCPDIKHVDGQNFTALVSRATTVRQKGSLCIVLRSCANIIVRQRPSEIEAVTAFENCHPEADVFAVGHLGAW